MNNGFYDLDPQERAVWYDKAREETGVKNFFDLPPDERAAYYDRAARAQQGWDGQNE